MLGEIARKPRIGGEILTPDGSSGQCSSSLSSSSNKLNLEIEFKFTGNYQENNDLQKENFILKKYRHNRKSDTYNYNFFVVFIVV